MPLTHRGKGTLGAAAGLLVALGLIGFVLVARAQPSNRQPSSMISAPPLPQRCGQGDAPMEAPSVASAPLANQTTMTYSVWCPYPGLAQGFASGVRITMRPNEFADPTAVLQAMAEENGVGATVGSVQGVPALEVDPFQDPGSGRYGSVEFVINDLFVGVYGDGSIDLPGLVTVAESISATLPAPPTPTPAPSQTDAESTTQSSPDSPPPSPSASSS
jgi:hypothetical protein